jgi:putative FmdB family regulatory protein
VPTYEFRCRACGEAFELVCPLGERERRSECPACGSREVAQVFGPIATQRRLSEFSPGHFERPPGRGSTPRWVGSDD